MISLVAQPPAPLDGEVIATDDPGDRREVLADWLTSPENPYFTRAIANRGRIIRIPIYVIQLVSRYERTRRKLYNELDKEPTIEEIAKILGITTKKCRMAASLIDSIRNLDSIASVDVADRILRDIPDQQAPPPTQLGKVPPSGS